MLLALLLLLLLLLFVLVAALKAGHQGQGQEQQQHLGGAGQVAWSHQPRKAHHYQVVLQVVLLPPLS